MSARPNFLLSGLLFTRTLPERMSPRLFRLAVQSLTFGVIAVAVTNLLGIDQAGVIAIFLVSSTLTPTASRLLDENRVNIWDKKKKGWTANRLTAASVFAMFIGVSVSFVIAALVLDPASIKESFSSVLRVAHLGQDTMTTRRFSTVDSLLIHNCLVLLSFLVLALLYRAYGMMLALSWNACVWGLALTLLVQRGMALTDQSAAGYIAVAALAVLPHLFVEALAYVLGSLAGVFLSRGMVTYAFSDPRMRKVMRACGTLLLFAVLCLVVAALLESQFAPAVLKLAGG